MRARPKVARRRHGDRYRPTPSCRFTVRGAVGRHGSPVVAHEHGAFVGLQVVVESIGVTGEGFGVVVARVRERRRSVTSHSGYDDAVALAHEEGRHQSKRVCGVGKAVQAQRERSVRGPVLVVGERHVTQFGAVGVGWHVGIQSRR